jgi:hypothetical protein
MENNFIEESAEIPKESWDKLGKKPRPIRFRGISVHSGQWVYGYVLTDRTNTLWYIAEGIGAHAERVLPESVGQFAGLKDKDETDIYEGDLFSAKIKGRDVIARADFIDGAFRCVQVDFVYSYTPPCFYKEDILRYQITVIGSIHTHPELIKQKV